MRWVVFFVEEEHGIRSKLKLIYKLKLTQFNLDCSSRRAMPVSASPSHDEFKQKQQLIPNIIEGHGATGKLKLKV